MVMGFVAVPVIGCLLYVGLMASEAVEHTLASRVTPVVAVGGHEPTDLPQSLAQSLSLAIGLNVMRLGCGSIRGPATPSDG